MCAAGIMVAVFRSVFILFVHGVQPDYNHYDRAAQETSGTVYHISRREIVL